MGNLQSVSIARRVHFRQNARVPKNGEVEMDRPRFIIFIFLQGIKL